MPKVINSNWPSASMRTSRFLILNTLAALALVACSTQLVFSQECQDSPILFALKNSLFSSSAGGRATVAASGFSAPYELMWAPGCREYAFLDDGALWLGKPGNSPKKVAIPATAPWFYKWSPDGKFLAVKGEREACAGEQKDPLYDRVSDFFLVDADHLSVESISHDCRTSVLGWSDNSGQVLLQKAVTDELPCDPQKPPCATGDVQIWNRVSRSLTTLVTARDLNQEGIGTFDDIARWDSEKHIIYALYGVSYTGLTEVLAAMDDRTAHFLWSYRCGGADYAGNGVFRADMRVYDAVGMGFIWTSTFVDTEGRVLKPRKAAQALAGVGDEKYEITLTLQAPISATFRSRLTGQSWRFPFPSASGIADSVWTPAGTLVFETYEVSADTKQLKLEVWVLGPDQRTGRKLFGDAVANPGAPYAELTPGGGMFVNGEIRPRIPPLVLGKWER